MQSTISDTPCEQKLFPQPATPSSLLAPRRWPGADEAATSALQKDLTDNHTRWHIFFDDRGFHNHAAHHLLAIWALGASAPIIDAAYKTHCDYQRPAFESPHDINYKNFRDHLGDQKYYSAYLAYFTEELLKNGLSKSFEEHIFSHHANFDASSKEQGKDQPEMLNRLFDGALHPFIHCGYGAEFGLHGIAAEGLAMAAVHSAGATVLLPKKFFQDPTTIEEIETGLAEFSHLSLNRLFPIVRPTGVHVFEIMARILRDTQFDHISHEPPQIVYNEVLTKHGDAIREYAELWIIDKSESDNMDKYAEQLIWMNTMIYGIGGWKKDADFNADFFSMHLVTSALFIPSMLPYLTLRSQALLLRAYLVTSLSWWIVRGRPALNIKSFFSHTSGIMHPPPGPHPEPGNDALPSPTDPHALTPNAWLPIIQTTLVHPNEHLCKIQRALAHFAASYGSRGQGHWAETGLEDAECLDGTLFLRVAMLTADRLGWVKEGENKREWDR
ncbi:hypothetical protein BJ138DRAFT_1170289 [Hygrophoropsis aurantiaca]|uniref:Uncharacterized protein n=1 Tax=Hygrophoropsis aurantiaca TaxID=72124 RepID=A0ACB8APP1_9AGAM|nr:hypothetical protein BJ138DRAFT_1170289 [Hygrophoropsis aurantiaca]